MKRIKKMGFDDIEKDEGEEYIVLLGWSLCALFFTLFWFTQLRFRYLDDERQKEDEPTLPVYVVSFNDRILSGLLPWNVQDNLPFFEIWMRKKEKKENLGRLKIFVSFLLWVKWCHVVSLPLDSDEGYFFDRVEQRRKKRLFLFSTQHFTHTYNVSLSIGKLAVKRDTNRHWRLGPSLTTLISPMPPQATAANSLRKLRKPQECSSK